MYMKNALVPFLIAATSCMPLTLLAQNAADTTEDKEVLLVNEQDRLKIHTLPYYSFGKGVGITSPDSIYQLNIRFRMQNRATYNSDADGKGTIDGQIRRLRLRFDGYVGIPKLTYAIQLSFAPGDVGEAQDGENINIIRDAVIWYQPNNKWSFGFGQTKLPGNRQRFNSSGSLQLTDRSINNAKFNIDRDFGFQIQQLNMYKNRFSYNFKAAISTGEGRNFTANDDLGLAYTGKVELYPFGAFQKGGEFFEGDILRESKPKLMLSGGYQFNNDAKKSQGQLGEYLFETRNLQSVFADLILKYKGFAFMSTYMSRQTKNPITYNPNNPNDIVYVYVGEGLDFQASYITKKNFEFIGRYSTQKVDKDIAMLTPNTQQYTVGLTKYIWEHTFKMQTEFTYEVRDYLSGLDKNSWYVRFQVEIGI